MHQREYRPTYTSKCIAIMLLGECPPVHLSAICLAPLTKNITTVVDNRQVSSEKEKRTPQILALIECRCCAVTVTMRNFIVSLRYAPHFLAASSFVICFTTINNSEYHGKGLHLRTLVLVSRLEKWESVRKGANVNRLGLARAMSRTSFTLHAF